MKKREDTNELSKRIVSLRSRTYSYPHINMVLGHEGFVQLPEGTIRKLISGEKRKENKRDARVVELAGKNYSYRHINLVLKSKNIQPTGLNRMWKLVGTGRK
jgi:intein-encoded DNA endonuclease-like protein